MDSGVNQCVATRVDFFEKYCTVPTEVAEEVKAFIADINSLGNSCSGVADFEAKFVSEGLSDRFNTLITKCPPKPYKMTEEDKQHAKETAKKIFKEDKERIINEAVADVAESATMAAESELMSQRRRSMSEAGVLDDYTRATNAIDAAARVGGFLKGLFKKKK